MTEYERSRTMPAQPEHVFDQAANAGRLDGRLPEAPHVDAEELPAVTVHEDRTGEGTSTLLRARTPLEWGTRDQGGYAGRFQVAGLDGGAGEVTMYLSFFDDSRDPGEHAFGAALETGLERLEEQVRLRVDHEAG
ncbi:SRPBCC family protein [Streptomyces sp. NPDC002788]